ncbi:MULTISPECIES: GntR family transcriptional regulator [Trueperella]|uniref:DNA-binding transcriptional regulator YhcF (GntR family) n=1 Tax=Trueperella abortisuis TaxID=445930 RepID=A0ABT9PLX9_9ACTO|nr:MULTISPECIES: GntR family transcriptional regulator [Trueperella]MCI7305741.1 GntR family transcriptional regulator [Trueperella sp.]MDP9833477.1 DNA-binding transcriptional regulator YhcF (GntR family) [Trueperella abortisuis]MDY5403342.1 GntR family transcriptional regulator [Trueperella sp.]
MNFEAGIPIWMQLVDEFTRRIVSGEWAPGARVPSVRELAAELGVNPNTAQRALAELERRELSRTERTAGRFITDSAERVDALRIELAQSSAEDYVRAARGLGLNRTQAQQLISESWSRHESDHPEGS